VSQSTSPATRDGCESAKASQYARKDEKRYFADVQYQMGWKDGFSICSRK
jgi:DnaJ-domain-containing protein 1